MKIRMRLTLLFFCFLVSAIAHSQSFEGEYISHKTSFKDEINPENSFIEETNFNIIIVPQTPEKEGVIIIQDPRIPKKMLIYSIVYFHSELADGQRILFNYQCRSEHTNEQESMITLYLNEKENLSLMISNAESSQVFFDIKPVK